MTVVLAQCGWGVGTVNTLGLVLPTNHLCNSTGPRKQGIASVIGDPAVTRVPSQCNSCSRVLEWRIMRGKGTNINRV